MSELWIVTGVSRGLGAAIAHAAFGADRTVVGMSRGGARALSDAAASSRVRYVDLVVDLADLTAACASLDSVLDAMPPECARAVLINNAAMVEPIGANAVVDARTVERALAVNLGAPMALTSRFLAATAQVPKRQVLNVSSGAARRPVPAWTAYCATKAGLDMHARCVNMDQAAARVPNPARAVSLAPGVIDTAMQASIRSVDADTFPDVARFVELKASGQLADAGEVAQRILRYLDRADFGATEIDDIRSAA